MTVLELKQKRASVVTQMKDYATKAREARAANNSVLAEEHDKAFDKAEAEERDLSKRIEQEQRLEEVTKREAAAHFDSQNHDMQTRQDHGKAKEYRAAFDVWMRSGVASLTAEQKALLQEHRAQSTSSTAGGYLIAPEYMPELEKSLKDYSGILQACRVIMTSTGANLPWPTSDATSRKAALVAENATSTATDFTFGQKSLDAFMYRDMAAVSLELLQDSAFDLGAFINMSFAESFGRAYNEHFTVGTGSSQPNGVVTASTLGKTAASATAFTRGEMLDLLHSVDPGYRASRSCGFMMNDAILAAIKKLALGSNDASPLWVPSMRDGAPDTIEGFRYWINQDMDSALTTGKKIMLFGDFSKYVVRQVMGMSIRRLEERFIDNGQVGFIAFACDDGELVNTSAVQRRALA